MKIRLLYTLLVAAFVAVAAIGAWRPPRERRDWRPSTVRLDSGELVHGAGRRPARHSARGHRDPDACPTSPIPTAAATTPAARAAAPTRRRRHAPTSSDQEEQKPSTARRPPRRTARTSAEDETTLDLKLRVRVRASKKRKARDEAAQRRRLAHPHEPDLLRRAARPAPGHRRAELRHPQVPASRSSCSRSTRPPASSTASTGRCWRRSTRSRPTTAAT